MADISGLDDFLPTIEYHILRAHACIEHDELSLIFSDTPPSQLKSQERVEAIADEALGSYARCSHYTP